MIYFGDLLKTIMTISPNREQKYFNVILEGVEPGNYQMKLFSSSGQQINARQISMSTNGKYSISISVADKLPSGIFTCNTGNEFIKN